MRTEKAVTMVANGAATNARDLATMTLPALPVMPAAEMEPAVTPEPKGVRVRHAQPVAQARVVAEVGQMLEGLRTCDAALQAHLAENGITAACVTNCTALHAAALAATEARQQAMAAERAAVTALEAAMAQALTSIMTLRQVARTVFKGQAAAVALGLNDEMPRMAGLFINEARRTLAAAQQAPYTATLATVAYEAERVQEIETEVDAVEAALAVREAAQGRAMAATNARDLAMMQLRRGAHQLRLQVKAVLRRHPEWPRPGGFV